jgi:hypothetical protein
MSTLINRSTSESRAAVFGKIPDALHRIGDWLGASRKLPASLADLETDEANSIDVEQWSKDFKSRRSASVD